MSDDLTDSRRQELLIDEATRVLAHLHDVLEAYNDGFRAGVEACIAVIRDAEEQSRSFRHTSYAWLVERIQKRCHKPDGVAAVDEKAEEQTP